MTPGPWRDDVEHVEELPDGLFKVRLKNGGGHHDPVIHTDSAGLRQFRFDESLTARAEATMRAFREAQGIR